MLLCFFQALRRQDLDKDATSISKKRREGQFPGCTPSAPLRPHLQDGSGHAFGHRAVHQREALLHNRVEVVLRHLGDQSHPSGPGTIQAGTLREGWRTGDSCGGTPSVTGKVTDQSGTQKAILG